MSNSNASDLVGLLFTLASAAIVIYGLVRARLPHMSSTPAQSAQVAQEPVQEPVSNTGIETEVPEQELTYSRHMTREQLIVLLACQKDIAISANAIFNVVKGNKNDVLSLIRDARAGNVEYYNDLIKRVESEVHDNGKQ